MATPILLIMTMLVVTTTEGVKESCPKDCKESHSSAEFDYYIFIQQYAAGMCLTDAPVAKSLCSAKWTIHGLWPTEKNSDLPQCCDYSEPFDTSLFNQSMTDELHKVWPSVEDDGTDSDVCFWEHEWYVHGTCACANGAIENELDFFNTVLGLYNKYDFASILSQGNVQMSNTKPYNMSDIVSAFVDKLQAEPFIQCEPNKEDKSQQVLTQMGLCFNKSFHFKNCPDIKKQQCQSEYPVKYPS